MSCWSTHLEALRIAVVEARLERHLEAQLDGVAIEELLKARDRARRSARAVGRGRRIRCAVRFDPEVQQLVEHDEAEALIRRQRVGVDVVSDRLEDVLQVRLVLFACKRRSADSGDGRDERVSLLSE